ncbi:MAG: zinc ribbon domain-containing protein [Methanobacteriota archaeon]
MAEGAQATGRLCPICDAQVPAGTRNCPSCGTDLALFDVPSDSADVRLDNKDNVDKILAELEKGEKDNALKGLMGIGTAPSSTPSRDGSGTVVMEVFQCPECGADVPSTSDTCQKCGVTFAEAQMYQCPLCNALMDANTTVCPGCGASFEAVEEDPASPAPAEPPKTDAPKAPQVQPPVHAPAKTEPEPNPRATHSVDAAIPKPPKAAEPKPAAPAPVEQVPMSFVDRMKQLRAQKEGVAPSAAQKPLQPTAQKTPTQVQPQKIQPMPAVPRPIQAQVAQPGAPRPAAGGDAMRQLPALVSKIKDDFSLAKRLDVDVTKAKDLINRAVTAGRERNLKLAVDLVSQGEGEVERSFTGFITKEVVTLEKQAKDVQASGIDVSGISAHIAKARTASGERKWAEAVTALDLARGTLTSIASEYFGAQKGLSSIKTVIEDAAALRIDLGEGRTLYEDCLKATVRKDWDTAKMLSEQCSEHFNKILPAYIANEMRKAKTKLLEVKMMNVNITKPVGHLKDANNQIKDGDYGTALHSIRLFRDAMTELEGADSP